MPIFPPIGKSYFVAFKILAIREVVVLFPLVPVIAIIWELGL